MPFRSRFLVGAALMAAAIAYLIYNAVQSTAQYYLTVDEARARLAEVVGQPVRVAGRVLPDGISWDPATLTLGFSLAQIPDEPRDGVRRALADGGAPFKVICVGRPRPDMFAAGRDVIVEGRIESDGVIRATQVLTSCPSKYQAEPQG
jgi:cytochrome c-type biogenesis protein CcmE